MSLTLTLVDATNVSGMYEQLSPGGGNNTLLKARALFDLSQSTVGAAVWLQLFEGTGAPATNAVPSASVPFDAQGYVEIDYGVTGRKMSGAWALVLSSTPLTFSGYVGKVGGGDLQALFDVQYI
jgi:hypothetical protein